MVGNVSDCLRPVKDVYVLLAALKRHLLRNDGDGQLQLVSSTGTRYKTHHLVLADGALETQDDLLGGLGLLVEDGLGLSSVSCGRRRISSARNAATSQDEPDCFRS